MESTKGDTGGKKPKWKKFHDSVDRSLTRQFQEMDRKYDQELKDFSIASDYQEWYNNTAYDNINGTQLLPGFLNFQWNFKCNKGVMLQFSLTFVLLVISFTHFSYPFGPFLSQWTISHYI